MRIGYARVSTSGQRFALQISALRKADCRDIYREKITGKARQRPALNRALAALRPGDVLVVWKLDRLGRSLQHLVEIIGALDERGIGFQSLSDNIDTTSQSGKLLFHVLRAIAEFEASLISERTKAGMQAAKRGGKRLGRPPCLTDEQLAEAQRLRAKTALSVAAIAEALTVNRSTLARALGRRIAA